MIRVVALVAAACLIFGVGGVLGAGGHLLNTAKDARTAIQAAAPQNCEKPDKVVDVSFSKTKYPHIMRHTNHALRQGWPSVLVLNRKGAADRRDRATYGHPTKDGYNRDEYPPALGRRTWPADVALVPDHENKSHGSVMGIKLRRYCDGTKFRYVFY